MKLQRAQSGDNEALLEIFEMYQPEMEYFASFIKMPREDSIQEMRAALMDLIRSGCIWEL